jgi:hypothetical protein
VAEPHARALPGPGQRLRCSGCGNVTRFDVVTRRRTAAYWHYTLAGELTVSDERDLEASAELLRCRWCGSERIEVAEAPAARAGDGRPDGSPAAARPEEGLASS